jgi:hypothetical protein
LRAGERLRYTRRNALKREQYAHASMKSEPEECEPAIGDAELARRAVRQNLTGLASGIAPMSGPTVGL